MAKGIYNSLIERKHLGKKSFAVLVDPDKVNNNKMQQLIDLAMAAKVDAATRNCHPRLVDRAG